MSLQQRLPQLIALSGAVNDGGMPQAVQAEAGAEQAQRRRQWHKRLLGTSPGPGQGRRHRGRTHTLKHSIRIGGTTHPAPGTSDGGINVAALPRPILFGHGQQLGPWCLRRPGTRVRRRIVLVAVAWLAEGQHGGKRIFVADHGRT